MLRNWGRFTSLPPLSLCIFLLVHSHRGCPLITVFRSRYVLHPLLFLFLLFLFWMPPPCFGASVGQSLSPPFSARVQINAPDLSFVTSRARNNSVRRKIEREGEEKKKLALLCFSALPSNFVRRLFLFPCPLLFLPPRPLCVCVCACVLGCARRKERGICACVFSGRLCAIKRCCAPPCIAVFIRAEPLGPAKVANETGRNAFRAALRIPRRIVYGCRLVTFYRRFFFSNSRF